MAAANAQDVEMFEVEDFGGQVAAPEDMAPKAGTVLNNAGGLSFEVDDMTRLRRFLILGTDTANYYVDVAALAVENAMSVKRMLDAGQGLAVVAEVVIISREGRAPKQGPGIFVLAMAARLGDKATRSAALRAVPLVCRTGSTLFEFVQRCKELGKVAGVGKQESAPEASEGVEGDAGKEAKAKAVTAAGRLSWGRAMRRAIASWYLDKEPSAVAYQVTKYSQRNGWSHADLLRLAHPNPQLHAEKKAAKRAATATEQDLAAGAATAEAALAVADAAAALEADAAAADGSEEPAASVVAVAAGGSEAEQQVRQRRVEDFKALFSFVVNGGKVLPEGAKQKAEEERRQAMLARKRKAEAEAGKAAERADASTEAAAAGATGGEVTAGETAEVAVSAGKEQEETAAGPAGGASESPLSAVLQYLVDAERLRKHIRAPALPKTQEEIEAAALAKEAKAARAKAGRGRGRGRGRGIRGRVVSDDSGDEAKEGVEEQAEKEAGAVAMDVEEGEEARAARLAARAAAIEEACGLIRKHRFSHEHIGDTILLKCPEVWSTLLDVGMPMTALVRNLGRLTSLGLLADSSTSSEATAAAALAKVTGQLRSARAVQAARLHPIVLLEARKQYQQGRGDKGGLTWMPCKAVEDALEEAFYLAFKNVQPTGKRFLAGVDVSGSMGFTACTGMRMLNAREAAAAMLMSLVRCEPVLHSMAFCSEFVPLDITKDMKLDEVLHKVSSLPFGSTDCSLPMLYALEKKIPVDVFVVLTDNETYAGRMTPVEALRKYRREMGIPAQLIVMAFSVTRFTIADPTDAGMLDVAGMDSAVPQVVAEFVSGKL